MHITAYLAVLSLAVIASFDKVDMQATINAERGNWLDHFRQFSVKLRQLSICFEQFILGRRAIQHWVYMFIHGGPKSKPPPIIKKTVLKITNEIRFLRKVKVW